MENRSDYEKRLGEKLEAAYMLEDIGPGMSREEFHRLILAAEKKKKRRRSLLGLAAACVALCLVCGGFVAGMTMRESASAGKDDETKTVQQGDSVVIGNGASENNQNVGVSTKTYTDIEDIPEDVRKKIHFLDSDEFELEKVKVVRGSGMAKTISFYTSEEGCKLQINEIKMDNSERRTIIGNISKKWIYGETVIYEKSNNEGKWFWIESGDKMFGVQTSKENINIEAIVDGLIG